MSPAWVVSVSLWQAPAQLHGVPRVPSRKAGPAPKSPSPGGEPEAAILAESLASFAKLGLWGLDVSRVCEDLTKKFRATPVQPKPPLFTPIEGAELNRKLEGIKRRISKDKVRVAALDLEVQLKRTESAKLSEDLVELQAEAADLQASVDRYHTNHAIAAVDHNPCVRGSVCYKRGPLST